MARQLWIVIIFMLLLTLIVRADEGQWKTYTVADGLVSPYVTAIFQDRIGNLWFGTGNGVSRFDREKFHSFTKKDGLPNGFIRQIIEDNQGHLWFIVAGSPGPREGSLVCQYDGKTFHQISEQEGIQGGVSDATLRDKSGNLWIANKYGLVKYDGRKFRNFGDNEFQQFVLAQSGKDGRIYTIFQSKNGDIWLAGGPGFGFFGGPGRMEQRGLPFVIRYDGSNYHYFQIESFLGSPNASINAIAEDDAGNLWFGGRFALIRYDGKNFKRFDNEKQQTTKEGFTTKTNPGEVIITWKEPLGPTGEPLFTVRI
jgi:ligand-binding sensor domain-containing protein